MIVTSPGYLHIYFFKVSGYTSRGKNPGKMFFAYLLQGNQLVCIFGKAPKILFTLKIGTLTFLSKIISGNAL